MIQGTREERGLPQKIWRVAKWMVPAAALYYLWREGMFSPERIRLTPSTAWNLAAALVLIAVATLLVSVRFHVLLRCMGVRSTMRAQARLNFPGLLVQQVASEAVFDMMRIVGAKKMGGNNATVLAALMADRLLGLLSLTTITVCGFAWFWKGSGWAYAAVLPLGAIVLLPCGLFLASFLYERQYSWFRRIPGSAFVASIGKTLGAFRHHGGTLTVLFCSSCVTHALLFAALYFCGRTLDVPPPTPAESIVGGAVTSFTGILPLPMAGLGVGETAFGETVARMRGHSEAASYAGVFLINRILIIALGVMSWLAAITLYREARESCA